MHAQVPLRPQQWTDISFSDGQVLNWQGDLLVIGIHEEAVKGVRDARCMRGRPA